MWVPRQEGDGSRTAEYEFTGGESLAGGLHSAQHPIKCGDLPVE